MATVRPAFYRELLTPALHRRFTGAAFLVLTICYVEGFLIAEKTSCQCDTCYYRRSLTKDSDMVMVSSWFCWPQSFTAVYVWPLRLHPASVEPTSRYARKKMKETCLCMAGNRSSLSPASTLVQSLFQLSTLEIFGWYFLSAWWFSEIYIWSSPVSASLGWMTSGK